MGARQNPVESPHPGCRDTPDPQGGHTHLAALLCLWGSSKVMGSRIVVGGSPWLPGQRAGWCAPTGRTLRGHTGEDAASHPWRGQGGRAHRGPRGALVCLRKDELVLGLSPGWPPGSDRKRRNGWRLPFPVPWSPRTACPSHLMLPTVRDSAGGPGAGTRALGPRRPCQTDIFESNHSQAGGNGGSVSNGLAPTSSRPRDINSRSGNPMSRVVG